MLRGLIPHGDQKRDKASFLLEVRDVFKFSYYLIELDLPFSLPLYNTKPWFFLQVIEYIQFLQEKVHKYEDPYQGWSHEPPKIMPWVR